MNFPPYKITDWKQESDGFYHYVGANIVFESEVLIRVWATDRPILDERAVGGRTRVFVGDWALTIERPWNEREAKCAAYVEDHAEELVSVFKAAIEDETAHLALIPAAEAAALDLCEACGEPESEGTHGAGECFAYEDDWGGYFDNQERCPVCNEVHSPPACRDPDLGPRLYDGGIDG